MRGTSDPHLTVPLLFQQSTLLEPQKLSSLTTDLQGEPRQRSESSRFGGHLSVSRPGCAGRSEAFAYALSCSSHARRSLAVDRRAGWSSIRLGCLSMPAHRGTVAFTCAALDSQPCDAAQRENQQEVCSSVAVCAKTRGKRSCLVQQASRQSLDRRSQRSGQATRELWARL